MKYRKIAIDIQDRIQNNEFIAGDQLPSLASIANQYECSKGTAIKAYELLIQKDIIYSKPQSGHYVAYDFFQHQVHENVYDLSTGNLPIDAFPLMTLKQSLNIAVDLYSEYSLQIELNGATSLRKEIKHYLEKQNIYTKDKNIFLALGVTQVISILMKMQFPNQKKKILIEEPTYSFTISQLKQSKNEILTINRDANGLDLNELETLFKNEDIKFFYTVPRNHNPLGTTLSHQERTKIVELSKKYDVYIVENDYFSDAYYIPKYDTIHYLSKGERCIYIKSFTKQLPHLRIGFAIIPKTLNQLYKDAMEIAYYDSYYMPALISQATLETILKNNILDAINKRIISDLKDKQEIYQRIVTQWDPELVKSTPKQSGFYTTLILNKNIDTNKIVNTAQKNQLLLKSTESNYWEKGNYDNSIRISLSKISKKDLSTALNLLYDIIEQEYYRIHNR